MEVTLRVVAQWPPGRTALHALRARHFARCAALSPPVPKPRRTTTKPAGKKTARKDIAQMELAERPPLKVSARAAATAEALAEGNEDRRRWSDRLWNALTGLSLVPFVCVFSIALYHTFLTALHKSPKQLFWKSPEFRMFGLGAGLWLLWTCVSFAFWKHPRPVRAYVFGHEAMHGLMARAFGGRIKRFHVSAEGGYIVTDKYNFLIALAPYLWPFYSVPVLAAWGIAFLCGGPPYLQSFFLAAFGFTWMFHLTFTLWVLPRGQSDLLGPGRIFSIMLIYLANTILLSGALITFARGVGWRSYGQELLAGTLTFYQWASGVFGQLVDFIGHLLRNSAGT